MAESRACTARGLDTIALQFALSADHASQAFWFRDARVAVHEPVGRGSDFIQSIGA